MGYKLISQLSHAELITPTPNETVAFYRDILGLQVVHQGGQSAWLRAWGEWFHHSLKITEGKETAQGHMAWRTDGPQELEDAAKALEKHGIEGKWTDGDVGHGRSYEFMTPGGHRAELVWEVDRYTAPEGGQSRFPNRPQKQPMTTSAVRRIDHVTILSKELDADYQLFRDVLGFRLMEGVLATDGKTPFFATLTSGAHNHDLAMRREYPDYEGPGGRPHHVAWYLDTRDEVVKALDILAENGYLLEHGPMRHGIGDGYFFVYFREPGGHRVELVSGGYWNYISDWETIWWNHDENANFAWYETQLPAPATPFRINGVAQQPRPFVAEKPALVGDRH